MAPRPKPDQAAEEQPTDVEPTEVEAPERVFKLRDLDGETPTTRVAIGSSPRVSLGPGEQFTTRDASIAAHLAATPELEEMTA